ncbi:MAG: SMP-30/gluconolactonase/LRE family protein [Acidimicrobiales bacterium]|nr:SMP-30/gluconolactonase/LRE family protein [Acidimicrobiales bacterium]
MSDVRGRVIATGLGFTEGPIVRQRGDYVVTSVDQGRLYRIDDGRTSVLAETGGGPNGAVEGADGRIFVAQNGRGVPPYEGPRLAGVTGGVQVVSPEGEVDWVTMDPVSPNDLCFGPDGLLYVTDPTRPIGRSNGRLWAVDPESRDTELLTQVDWYPNGIGFGLDAGVLFVADSTNGRVLRYPLDDGRLGAPEPVLHVEAGQPDGFDFDLQGNLVLAVPAAGRIETWSCEGELLDVTVAGPHQHYTNLALADSGTLILCDAHEGTVIEFSSWPSPGLPLYPFRPPG